MVQAMEARWDAITSGSGSVYNYDIHPDNHRSWGIGRLWSLTGNLGFLSKSVKLMLAKDVFLRLQPVQSIENVGMGKLPKLAANKGQGTASIYPPLSFLSPVWRPTGI